jgi:hypothetical protein
MELAHHCPTSVIIDDLHIFRARIRPSKANTPLLVDPDAVLASAVALEGLEAVARRNLEVIDSASDLQLPQPAARHPRYVDKPPDAMTLRKRLGIGALE